VIFLNRWSSLFHLMLATVDGENSISCNELVVDCHSLIDG
jgi:hypothetical protein